MGSSWMMRNITQMAIGIVLMVLGVFIMTKLHRNQGSARSILSSILEFLLDTVIGLLSSDWIAGAGTIAVLMVLIGFFMMLINFLQIIKH